MTPVAPGAQPADAGGEQGGLVGAGRSRMRTSINYSLLAGNKDKAAAGSVPPPAAAGAPGLTKMKKVPKYLKGAAAAAVNRANMGFPPASAKISLRIGDGVDLSSNPVASAVASLIAAGGYWTRSAICMPGLAD